MYIYVWITVKIMFSIYTRLMDKNEDYNFESLSGASNLEEVCLYMIYTTFRPFLFVNFC